MTRKDNGDFAKGHHPENQFTEKTASDRSWQAQRTKIKNEYPNAWDKYAHD